MTGVFGYSDEDGTEAASYDDKLTPAEIAERAAHVTQLVEELTSQRAEERIGESVQVLIERIEDGEVEGRAAHQGPEVDGITALTTGTIGGRDVRVGDMIDGIVRAALGVDLIAEGIGDSR